jgi:hypothetical protein
MVRNIHLKCKRCEGEVLLAPSQTDRVTCPHCTQSIEVFMNTSMLNRNVITACVSCGHDAFYVQKDFNRQLGITIVSIGIAISIYFFARGMPMYAMAALGLSAAIDFVAYRLVRDVTVCYSCHALYRGFERNPDHEPFDLKKLEKYGGRSPRL